jgi:hypothetical protein
MEWAVVWWSGARAPGHALAGTNFRKRERQTGRSGSVTAPVEMRLQKLGGRR